VTKAKILKNLVGEAAILPDFGQRFGAIYADPPWHFKARSTKGYGRSAVNHYPVLSLGALKAMPVAELAYDDAVLFLWVPWPNLLDGFAVIEAWGFTYKTVAFVWVKVNRDDTPYMGMGFWTRSNTEICLLATRGKPKRLKADVRQVILARRSRHSAKPPFTHIRIERLVAGPYLELFAREKTPGWTAWGNEIEENEDD
jgi:N6-adenosine-specific RNA methylase IME4